jgi:endoglucanase
MMRSVAGLSMKLPPGRWWACALVAALAGWIALVPATPVLAQVAKPAMARTGLALHGMLPDKAAWRSYKTRFITEQGRVVDTANGRISHSEGQGYGMLLAVAADDRAAFERIWAWTRANLLVRDDQLAAWRWEPDRRPAVADMNNATDGDLLIAWALTEAGEVWADGGYRIAARRIAVEIGRKLILPGTANGSLLLPGMAGFSADDRPDGPVLNLSYYVFPAFQRLPIVAPEFDWAELGRAGLRLIDKARFSKARLPSDWVTLKDGMPQPAQGFPAEFSYNALRVPLYLAWAGFDQPRHHVDYLNLWRSADRRVVALVELTGGTVSTRLSEPGYLALPALSACASAGVPFPRHVLSPQGSENYYPATLHLLALVAARMRYPSCLQS